MTTKRIPLTQGKFAIVDAEDFEKVDQFKWCAIKDKNTYYAVRESETLNGKRKTIIMHRAIINAPLNTQVDHKNRNGLDNRKENLRICTHAQNQQNACGSRNSKSKYKGVTWSKECRKWRAQLCHNGVRYHLGVFTNEIDAAKAYDLKAKTVFGDFAFLNFKEKTK